MTRLRVALYVLLHGAVPSHESPRAGFQDAAPGFVHPSVEAASEPPLAPISLITTRLIELRDQLLPEQEGTALPTALAAVDRRLVDILALDQVTAFDDCGGPFEPDRHNVVSSFETKNPELHYQVASTVRPGYLRLGRLLRRQDVIVYRNPGDRIRELS